MLDSKDTDNNAACTLISDFDRVLFDTDAFIARLKTEGLGGMERGHDLIAAIERKGIDLEEYVYPEARDHLEKHGAQCIILSSAKSRRQDNNEGNSEDKMAFQEWKIKASGLGDFVKRTIVVEDDKKAELEGLREEFAKDVMWFVDDEVDHITAAEELGINVFQIKIENKATLEGMPKMEGEFKPGFVQFIEHLKSLQAEHAEAT